MDYSASIQWFCPEGGIARIHKGLGGRVGDPFVWSVTLHRLALRVVILMGARDAPPKAAALALNDELYRHGVRVRKHERITPRGTRIIRARLRKPRG